MLQAGFSMTMSEQGRFFTITRVILLHRNGMVFKGRMTSTDGVVEDMEGFVSFVFRRR